MKELELLRIEFKKRDHIIELIALGYDLNHELERVNIRIGELIKELRTMT